MRSFGLLLLLACSGCAADSPTTTLTETTPAQPTADPLLTAEEAPVLVRRWLSGQTYKDTDGVTQPCVVPDDWQWSAQYVPATRSWRVTATGQADALEWTLLDRVLLVQKQAGQRC